MAAGVEIDFRKFSEIFDSNFAFSKRKAPDHIHWSLLMEILTF